MKNSQSSFAFSFVALIAAGLSLTACAVDSSDEMLGTTEDAMSTTEDAMSTTEDAMTITEQTEYVDEGTAGFVIGGPSFYRLVRQGSGKCLDVAASGTANGTNIQQWTCNGTQAQGFRLRDAGGGWTFLSNMNSGKCVDATASGTANGTNIQQWDCNGTGAQKFYPEFMGNGYYRLHNWNDWNKCVDVSGNGYADGTNIQLWSCNGGEAQNWKFQGYDGCRDPDEYRARVAYCNQIYNNGCPLGPSGCAANRATCIALAYNAACSGG